jgi:hypothetical protein
LDDAWVLIEVPYNRSLCLLLKGRISAGLPGLEMRFENEDNIERWRRDNVPFWRKGEPLSGPLFLLAEQGVGDTSFGRHRYPY